MSINIRMNVSIMDYSYMRIPHGNENKVSICSNMDESYKYHVEQNNPDAKNMWYRTLK